MENMYYADRAICQESVVGLGRSTDRVLSAVVLLLYS